ncbi:trypsin-like serine peptidase [Caulobacter endophyticus]|uniref:trypsin-like serine peptidase n=1 Tax=Caulobacter endophyticus TaxID=2172652 RepID=UPI00240EDD9C|nr:trypsin-like peptidase domain-containing protein [Caulobacter endophyticus]MDG2528486.1 trypsin-like peptidase domain-containing protein [Caulobacter endophyticus]
MDDASPPTASSTQIDKLIDLIAPDWAQIQGVWELFRVEFGFQLRADTGAIDVRGFLAEALGVTIARGRLRKFATRLEARGLLKDGFDELAAQFYTGGLQPQRYVNPAWPSQFAHATLRAAAEACDHVCTITIDGQHKGTGVLIAPTLVATAAHVIAPLVQDSKEIEGSLDRLRLTFTDPDSEEEAPRPVPARLRSRWLRRYSPQGRADGLGAEIDGIEGLDEKGPWDWALIHLMNPPRQGQSGAKIYEHPTPAPQFGIHILHHPATHGLAAMPLLWSVGAAKKALGDPTTLRLLHDANTDGGSSGAPCFDQNWRIVALHQGGSDDIAKADQINRAVPVHRWLDDLAAAANEDDETPYLREVLEIDGLTRPVLGRRDIQRSFWASMTRADEDQVFVIRGPDHAGKTFTRLLLRSLAVQAGQRLVVFEMQNVQADDAVAFAELVLGGVGVQLDPHATAPDGLTTLARGLRNGLVPTLLAELERVAAGSPLWIFLDGFKQSNLPLSGPVQQLVEALICASPTAPNLRLVLAGWQGAVQVGPGRTACVEDLASGPSAQDIADHVWLCLAPPEAPMSPDVANLLKSAVSMLGGPGDYPTAVERARTVLGSMAPMVKLALAKDERHEP